MQLNPPKFQSAVSVDFKSNIRVASLPIYTRVTSDIFIISSIICACVEKDTVQLFFFMS